MKTRIIIGANAYAVIESDARRLDVLLNPGESAAASLRATVAEMREHANAELARAEFIESAISQFKGIQP